MHIFWRNTSFLILQVTPLNIRITRRAMYVQRNTDTRCSVEEINYYTCCVCARACVRACVRVCVCTFSYAPYCISICGPSDYHIFPHYLINGTNFGTKSLKIKYVFWFSLWVLSETFLISRTIQRDIIINVNRFSHKVPLTFVRF